MYYNPIPIRSLLLGYTLGIVKFLKSNKQNSSKYLTITDYADCIVPPVYKIRSFPISIKQSDDELNRNCMTNTGRPDVKRSKYNQDLGPLARYRVTTPEITKVSRKAPTSKDDDGLQYQLHNGCSQRQTLMIRDVV